MLLLTHFYYFILKVSFEAENFRKIHEMRFKMNMDIHTVVTRQFTRLLQTHTFYTLGFHHLSLVRENSIVVIV